MQQTNLMNLQQTTTMNVLSSITILISFACVISAYEYAIKSEVIEVSDDKENSQRALNDLPPDNGGNYGDLMYR